MTPIETVKVLQKRFELEWPVETRLTSNNYETMDTEPGGHTIMLSAESEEIYMNELFARAKVAERYNDALLGTLKFEDEGRPESAQRRRCEAFYHTTMPVRNVWTHRVMREFMGDERYEKELEFIAALYEDGLQSNSDSAAPFMFFSYYLLLDESGRRVPPPKRSAETVELMALFDRWANAEPSPEVLVACYNYFRLPGDKIALLTPKHAIGFTDRP